MAERQASYSIRFDSNAKQVGAEGADSLEQFKSAINRSKEAVKTYSSTLRDIKGASDEAKGAREQLKAKIEAEKTALTANTIALLKQGTSFEQLALKEKQAAAQKAKLDAAMKTKGADEAREKVGGFAERLKAAGGPARELGERLETLKTGFSTSAGTAALLVGAIGTVIAAAGAITGKLLELSVALGRWIVESADAARNAGLLRLAWTGSASGALHLGHQIDALATKVPTAKDQLAGMAGEMMHALNNSRVSGQGIVDTFNAVAMASAAMGDQVGKQLQDIVARAKNTGNVQIGAFELQGTGISRDDIAQKLALRMKIGVDAARAALAQGRAPVNAAAAAIRDAVEQRFGEVNAKKLISLGSTFQKLKDNIAGLASGVNIEPLLRDFADLAGMFSSSTVFGKNLKAIVTTIGDAIGSGIGQHKETIKHIFLYGELAAIKFMTAVKKIDLQLQSIFGKDYKDKIAAWGLGNAESQMRGFADLVERTGNEIQKTITFLRGMGEMAGQAADTIKGAWTGFEDLGGRVIDGLIGGITGGIGKLKDAIGGVAEAVKRAFTSKMQIGSPSKVFEGYGKNTVVGYQRGVETETPRAQRAVDRMAPSAPGGASAPIPAPAKQSKGAPAPARGRASQVNVHIHVGSGGGDVAKQLASPTFLQNLTRAIEDALTTSGLPMQAEPQT